MVDIIKIQLVKTCMKLQRMLGFIFLSFIILYRSRLKHICKHCMQSHKKGQKVKNFPLNMRHGAWAFYDFYS